MPKHYESDDPPKLPPKTSNKYKKKDVFETQEKTKSKKTKDTKKPKRKY